MMKVLSCLALIIGISFGHQISVTSKNELVVEENLPIWAFYTIGAVVAFLAIVGVILGFCIKNWTWNCSQLPHPTNIIDDVKELLSDRLSNDFY